MTRFISDKTKTMDVERFDYIFPPLDERMGIEEMILGYTINGAKQLGIEKTKGSIEAGKDADYLVFDTDLLTADPDGLSNILPVDVFYSGQKMHYNPFNPDDQSKEESVFKGRPAPYFAMEEMWMKLMEEMWKKYTDEGVD